MPNPNLRTNVLRIGLVSEWFEGPDDEGIHSFVKQLANHCGQEYIVKQFAIGSDFPANRLFLDLHLRSSLHGFNPNLVFYVSPSCARMAALVRAKVLKLFVPNAGIFIVALQPAEYGKLERQLIRSVVPDGVFFQSRKTVEWIQGLCPTYFLPSGVDTNRFVPIGEMRRRELRQGHGIDEKAFMAIHIGHINRDRNILLLKSVASSDNTLVCIVGSSTTPQDTEVTDELTRSGARIITDYLPRIEELYQMSDAYLFPVMSESAAIGVPLSVLEAMACNLPVITTRFGGLPLMFEEGNGFFYFDRETELHERITRVRELARCSTRQMVEPYNWQEVAANLIKTAVGRVAA